MGELLTAELLFGEAQRQDWMENTK